MPEFRNHDATRILGQIHVYSHENPSFHVSRNTRRPHRRMYIISLSYL